MWIFFSLFFCSLVLFLGGNSLQKFSKLVKQIRSYFLSTHTRVSHKHAKEEEGQNLERFASLSSFFVLSLTLSVVLCVWFKCRGKCEKFQICLKRYALIYSHIHAIYFIKRTHFVHERGLERYRVCVLHFCSKLSRNSSFKDEILLEQREERTSQAMERTEQ